MIGIVAIAKGADKTLISAYCKAKVSTFTSAGDSKKKIKNIG